MKKYLTIFKISLQQEFAYRMNFIMWRVRNILQIFLVFFLWDTIFANTQVEIFGYDREKILTYVFGLLVVRAFVLSARAIDVAGDISRGDLSNYLLKPINYFKYWLTRDFSSKALNLSFAVVETTALFFILKPPFFLQTDPVYLFGFVVAIGLSIFLYFLLLFITSAVPFWIPEAAWGVSFMLTAILVEFLSGALFPLDILPSQVLTVLNLTPFPYLIFFPLQVYLGQVSSTVLAQGILVSGLWAIILWFAMNSLWRKGIKVYQSHGR